MSGQSGRRLRQQPASGANRARRFFGLRIFKADVRPDWSLRPEGPIAEVCSGSLSSEFVEAYLSGEG